MSDSISRFAAEDPDDPAAPDPEAETITVAASPRALAAHAGDRLDRWLAAALSDVAPQPLSRSRLKALIQEGAVRAGEQAVTNPSASVQPGATYHVAIPPPEPAVPEPQAIPLQVLYEDAHLIVVDKPAGMTVHPAPGAPDGTLVNALLHHCGDSLSGIGGVRRPGIVHRIDKDTSGVLVAAKTDAAHAGLAALFQAHDIDREYRALAWGHLLPLVGRVETDIGRHPVDRLRMAVRPAGTAKHAVTHYKVLDGFGEAASLVSCRLETGRTHQIRVHLAHLGHPLIGDPLYARGRTGKLGGLGEAARAALTGFPRQALHAVSLGFVHPVTGREIQVESPLPADFQGLISALRENAARP